ncbi:hypothetical protein QJS10_CPB21g00077 [Acorus calamus]|uniref:Uncharacterized protein n=1 Tax=Acorus calamus TaxID=4465 RepID=A0AAV9C7K9_ACOCL|nr:hypothetical protein QJS10_CPB21g00077 [Acorus calamus]
MDSQFINTPTTPYVVGAEAEIWQMHETAERKRVVEGVAPEVAGKRDGSHKCYSDKGMGFRSCTACNEDGLIG